MDNRLQNKKSYHITALYAFAIFLFVLINSVFAQTNTNRSTPKPAAAYPEQYIRLLEDRRVGLVVNHTSYAKDQHLVDLLLDRDIEVTKIFAPEHGFRGEAGAGEIIESGKDPKTGLPVLSLYGDTKKPTDAMLEGIDVMVFDIQDVGVRFYTYISTLHYVMEASAENDIPVIVLDRPNPNGYYVDGPILDMQYQSFVGMHPIPVVHGLTVGELAKMINGEGWLKDDLQCELTVVECENYSHSSYYSLPIAPSPNLPNDVAINLYPSLCFFEGTVMSIGRGTSFPFQVIGYPDEKFGDFTFTPESIKGKAMNPKHEGQKCYGKDLRDEPRSQQLELKFLIRAFNMWGKEGNFFTDYFDKLAGTGDLKGQIKAGLTEDEIRLSWQPGLYAYKTMREKYLLYPDFK